MRRSALLALPLLLAACAPEEAPDDSYPPVRGLPAAEDLDPEVGVAEYALEIAETDVELIDGQTVTAWTYNGRTPGPLLQARVGDRMKITVTNRLEEPTTVHWHGIKVPVEMDGIVNGAMPAIAPGESRVYEFVVPDAGTYWYHPHVRSNVQVEAGLYGALIVHEAEEQAPEVDADRMFVLDDVLLDEDGQIAEEAWPHPVQMHGRSGNVLLTNGKEDDVDLDLAPGAVERWRFVNTANARTMTLRFPGLEVREIGADGGLWPQAWTRGIDELELPVGARAELEVRLAEGSDGGRVEQIVLVLNGMGNVVEDEVKIIEAHLDTETQPGGFAGHTADPEMRLPDVDAEGEPDYTLEIGATNDEIGTVWTLNGRAWPDAGDWEVEGNTPTLIEIVNPFGPEHPFHVHGQFFSVESRNGDTEPRERGLRDTVRVGGGQTIRIATDFDNLGTWMVHCHILEHAERGMMTTVEVR